MKIQFVVVGSGRMAKKRTKSILASGKAELIGVASKQIQNARKFGKLFDCKYCVDNYKELEILNPDFVLVEVPHSVQDKVVSWAIELNYHVFIGGCLASSLSQAKLILQKSEEQSLIVEAGYEARYKPVWEQVGKYINENRIGQVIAIRSIALSGLKPDSWYYSQRESGGMPLTHMTYTFINPIRWIFGEPEYVSAFSNKIKETDHEKVSEETCIANLLFRNQVLYSVCAGYVKPTRAHDWKLTLFGTEGKIEVWPSDMGSGKLKVYCNGNVVNESFSGKPNGFDLQAQNFLAALDGEFTCRNTPKEAMGDLEVASAIALSSVTKKTVYLKTHKKRKVYHG